VRDLNRIYRAATSLSTHKRDCRGNNALSQWRSAQITLAVGLGTPRDHKSGLSRLLRYVRK